MTLGSDATYTLYLDANGYVLGIEEVEGSDPTIDDVYYVALVWKESNESYGQADSSSYYAQLVGLDGTITEVELESRDKAGAETILANAGSEVGTDPYTDTDYGKKLVTISDKKWTGEAYDAGQSEGGTTTTTTYKANDGKYDLTVWAPDSDWTKVENAGADFTKSMTRLVVGDDTYRLNSSTQYIMIGQSGEDLEANVATGGIAYNASTDTVYLITEENSSIARYVVIGSTDEIKQTGDFSSDLIYIADVDYDEGDGYVTQEVYFADGTAETIDIDVEDENGTLSEASDLAVGFYAYDTNEDGYYILSDDVDGLTLADDENSVWDEDEGVLTGASYESLFENLLSVSKDDSEYNDIDVSNAAFVDVHDTDDEDQYNRTVSSLSALKNLFFRDNYTTSATLALNVDENGAVTIFVTNLTHVRNA